MVSVCSDVNYGLDKFISIACHKLTPIMTEDYAGWEGDKFTGGISGFPATEWDGTNCAYNTSVSQIKGAVDTRIAVAPKAYISLVGKVDGNNSYLRAQITITDNSFTVGKNLWWYTYEDNVNASIVWHGVVRKWQKVAVTEPSLINQTKVFTTTISVDSSWKTADLKVALFVELQANTTCNDGYSDYKLYEVGNAKAIKWMDLVTATK